MIIQCTSCKARFQVPEAKIAAEGTNVRCSRCKNVFKAYREDPKRQKTEVAPAPEPEVASTPPPAAEPKTATPAASTQAKAHDTASFEFVMASSEESPNLADTIGDVGAVAAEEDVAPPGEDDSLEDIFAMPEDEPQPQPASQPVNPQPLTTSAEVQGEQNFSLDEWDDGFSEEVSSSQSPSEVSVQPTQTEAGEAVAEPSSELDLDDDDPFAAVSSAPEPAPQEVPARAEHEQSKATKAPGKKRSHVHRTSPSSEFKARQASHEENKFATLLVNGILGLASIIVIVIGFSYRGVDLWKAGQRYWFFEQGFVSNVEGPVIVKYQGFDLVREDGEKFFVIDGILLNRSSEEEPPPNITSLLTSDADLGIQESKKLPCCLDVDIAKIREIQSTLDVELLYNDEANQEPIKPDEWRRFLLVLEPESKPIYYKTVVAKN